MDWRWVDDANAADLDALARALLEGRIRAPYSTGAVQLAGFSSEAVAFLNGAGPCEPRLLAELLQKLAEERRRAADWYSGVAQLVWSGPAESQHGLRDTRVVLDELFGRAERHVLVSSYVITRGRQVFAALGERLKVRPDLAVEFYVNLSSRTGAPETESTDAETFARGFAEQHWPENAPLPVLHYAPQGRKQGHERGILHAKCVVVDERWTFLTSANFTEAAQERNVEAGVLLDHPSIAKTLVGRFVALRERGAFKRMH